MKKLRGFTLSYNFVPYLNSASIDFFKKVKEMPGIALDVIYVKEGEPTRKMLDFQGEAELTFVELDVQHDAAETNVIAAGKIAWRWLKQSLLHYRRNRQAYDFILSHSFSMMSHLSALILKVTTRKPWIAYFSDPIKGNPYFEHGYIETGKIGHIYQLIEKWTFARADQLIFTNTVQRDLSLSGKNAQYAAKAAVIEHCFDPEMFAETEIPTEISERLQQPGTHIMHVGTMFPPKRIGALVIEALSLLNEDEQQRVHLHFVGKVAAIDAAAASKMGKHASVYFHPPVDYFTSLHLMQRADILLLIDGDFTSDGVNESPFLPGKYAEYIGAMKPIMAVTMKSGAVADIQRKLGYEVLAWNVSEIATYLRTVNSKQVTREHQQLYQSFTTHAKSTTMAEIIHSLTRGVK